MRTTSMRAPAMLSLAVMLAGCGGSNTAGDNARPMFTDDNGLLTVPAASPLRSHLTIQAVTGGGQSGFVDLPAAVEADPARVANIVAPLTGRITALKVGIGQRVRQGQVLAVIASGDMAQAWADNDKARDAADTAKRALDRAQGVREAGGAAVKDVEAAQSAYNQAAAELARTRARLASLGAGAGHGRDLVLTAPQSGVVTALSVAAGAQVSDPTAALMTVSNLARVFVTANVAEGQVGAVRAGDGADITLTAYPGQTLHGRVGEVDPVLQPDTRRQKVRIALGNEAGKLMPGMYATVRLAGRGADGVFVPQSALLMNNDSVTVLVEVRPWVFQRRAVSIGDETDTSVHVLSGLAAGDHVVVRGGVLLND